MNTAEHGHDSRELINQVGALKWWNISPTQLVKPKYGSHAGSPFQASSWIDGLRQKL